MRVVLDTNIFISGIFWGGIPNKIILEWKNKSFILISSLETINELIRVLKDFKIRLDDEIIDTWIDLITTNSEIVLIEDKLDIVKNDKSDNKFLETAEIGQADYLITQDDHLLNIKEYKNIKILTPLEFLKILK
ncbi:MAG: putative toxin-antitoxin system toxin component, PIN family [Candidatus Nanoarchaeia archaeon]|nr:putative toxin-antitoxin system toxin component, PIN family [Candidatus Nanoarchaeia archaeon]